jgi:hypothetical protein
VGLERGYTGDAPPFEKAHGLVMYLTTIRSRLQTPGRGVDSNLLVQATVAAQQFQHVILEAGMRVPEDLSTILDEQQLIAQ